jgi:deoxyribodipyrimidine photo-lyase
MKIMKNRSRNLNEKPTGIGPVIYWMDRDICTEDNWALLYAQKRALEAKVPLLVVYNLMPGFLGGALRQHIFKIQGLREVEENLMECNIHFYIVRGAHTEKDIVAFVKEHDAGLLVTDFSPLRIQRTWKEYVAKHIEISFTEVDAHNVVPAWIVSQKSEVGARTLRPKLHKLLPEYLEKFPKLVSHPYHTKSKTPTIDWKTLENDSLIDTTVSVVAEKGGMKQAHITLEHFIESALPRYGSERNDPLAHAQSNLSPYLHYGMIAPARVALEAVKASNMPLSALIDAQKNKAKIDPKAEPTFVDSVAAFLEELIVRRELSDNFCLYNLNTYDTVECFPGWALASLRAHAKTTREYVYTRAQFEKAQTHDDLWNAAQLEMVQTGKMHGYMRMYWAKKILEWTKSPEDAMAIAIYLNDRYELDGRDPNGYAGIAWSIGGVHDRAWFTRPIFGLVRYMARSGCESKFDVSAYIERFTKGKTLF